MRKKNQYAAIGYVVSKFMLPMARRKAKRSARGKAADAVTGTAGAARRNPAKTSLVVGTAVGAAGWLLARTKRSADTDTSTGDE